MYLHTKCDKRWDKLDQIKWKACNCSTPWKVALMLNTVSSTQMKSHINVHQCKTHFASSCVLLCRSLHWIKTQRFVIENNFAQYIEIVFHHHWKPFCSIYLHSPVLHHDWKQFCHILSILSPINTNKSVSYLFFFLRLLNLF